MNLFFIHQNMPGQFRNLIAALAASERHRIICVGQRYDASQPGVGRVRYPAPALNAVGLHPFLVRMDQAVRNGEAVAAICARLAREVFRPDAIIGHPGWGETLYLKQVLPDVPVLLYGEFFYRTRGADVDFDPATPQSVPEALRTHTMNAPLLLAMDAADWIMTPTEWQRSLHPDWSHGRMSVIFDGVDAKTIRPDPMARFVLPDGRALTPSDEVVTFAARGLEPYRGYPTFMRALPKLLRRRGSAHVVVAGADSVVYGRPHPQGGTWQSALLEEIDVDPARVHFVGTLPSNAFLRLLQVSSAHVYLTVPFVLSWSMLEAMAAGCLVLGSATPPVKEVIADGLNGLLVDFFDSEALADRLADALARRESFAAVRAAARETVINRYDLAVCLPPQIGLIKALTAGRVPVG